MIKLKYLLCTTVILTYITDPHTHTTINRTIKVSTRQTAVLKTSLKEDWLSVLKISRIIYAFQGTDRDKFTQTERYVHTDRHTDRKPHRQSIKDTVTRAHRNTHRKTHRQTNK